MLALAAALLLTASQTPPQAPRRSQVSAVRDSTPLDSVRRRQPTRRPVTAEALRTAFLDARAGDLLERARRARLSQDSALKSYDARVRERVTARMAIGSAGPERVMYRQESAFRVRWQELVGAHIELTGARVGIPIAPEKAQRESLEENVFSASMTPVPYFPGQEVMWLGTTVREQVDDRGIVQPLAKGAEAYYTYATGDSMSWTLPGGRMVKLRELNVRPRSPEWNLAVGSLWFDVESGQLVRAAYRLATPMDMWTRVTERRQADSMPLNPVYTMIAKALTSPMKMEITAIAIEYGLFDGKFWLPRSRALRGKQQVSFARMPIEVEQAFSYAGINTVSSLAAVKIDLPPLMLLEPPDSLNAKDAAVWRNRVVEERIKARRALQDSLKKTPCDSTGHHIVGRERFGLPVAVAFPCDVGTLVTSTDFDKPIYDQNEQLFGTKERDALIADALPFGAQALIKLGALPRPTFQYGLSMSRYNRIEGFSTGLRAEQQIGAGYVVSASARLGAADREPNGEVSFARTNLDKSVTLTAYNRLVSANDWGNPLSFGSSMSAFLFGRDEGFYYRASGAELLFTSDIGGRLEWRLFGEQERTATQRTEYSLGPAFVPNIVASTGPFAGASVRWKYDTGLDPHRLRSATKIVLEAAAGDSTYGRAAMDMSLSTGLPLSLAAALTLSGGTSVGQLPPQRRWLLGGAYTVRGQSPDTAQSGNAYWLTRAEFGIDRSAYRYMLFGDLGWTGDRETFREVGRPLSGVGLGLSMMDGLIRIDMARGLYPRKQNRVSAYLNAHF